MHNDEILPIYNQFVLIFRGLIDYNELVINYWPEFGANGKENVTVEMLLSHQVSS